MKLRNKPRILRQDSVLDLGASTSIELPVSPNQMRLTNARITVLEGEMDTAQTDILANAADIEYLLGAQAADVGVLFEGMPAVVTGTRTLAALEKTFRVNAGSMNTEEYPLTDIRFQFPFNEIRTAKVNDTFVVQAWIDEPGFAAAAGHICTYLPKTFYRKTSAYTMQLSKYARPGYTIFPLFWDYTNEVERDGVWIGTFKGSKVSGENKLTSQIGVGPSHSMVMYGASGFRGWATANGTGWGLADLAVREYLGTLMLIAAASWNSQTVIGKGCEAMRYSADDKVVTASVDANTVIVATATAALYNVGEFVHLGSSLGATTRFSYRKITEKGEPADGKVTITVDGAVFTTSINDVLFHCPQLISEETLIAMGNESGYIGTNGRVPVCFFGIWDLWGNIWEWVDGAWKHDTAFTVDVASAADTDVVTVNGTALTKGAAAEWQDAETLAAAADALANVGATFLNNVVTITADAGKYLVVSRTNVAGTITVAVSKSGFFYTFDETLYAAIIDTAPATATNYTRHATELPRTSGYLGEMEGVPSIPKTLTGGSSAAGTCDYYYYADGYRGLLVGGSWHNPASYPGFWDWNVLSAPSYTYVTFGSRLLGRP